ncbi:bifunctional serine/threonine-protein kinase/universal stress protein [Geothrix sp. 21YS21S-4]|uniref:serine/threonine protein kinase n=1 Tax=Geothrix sp. 21YS21S-4 TaxID=3068889 RepID=UPI0027BAF214|nr:bifunctional serine/threonine-protein kinase/universal stress protein [Geothrix sp. 21YS21S-4]
MPERLRPGLLLDGFLLEERIHRGGMAELWAVSRSDLDLPLLMKLPVLCEGVDPAAIVGFEMEQMILPRLEGPHVPRFVAQGEAGDRPHLVMERIPGPSLLPALRNLPWPAADVAALGARLAVALDALHRQHVIHFDVKPSNLLQRPTGEIVLVDFGLARHAQLPDLMGEEFRLPYGTAPYMAPEQILGHRKDPRSDQFAAGVLMYFFLTGRRPFGDPQRLRGLKRRLWRDPVPPRRLRPDCPPWLQEAILRCLEVHPAWRYPTAAQLALALAEPGQVTLTARSEKLRQDPFTAVLRRRFADPQHFVSAASAPARSDGDAPILAVAVDLSAEGAPIAEQLRAMVARMLPALPGARVACLNVLKQGRISLDPTLDAQGRNIHLQRLLELKAWGVGLGLEEGRISFHVLESPDPAAAILQYASANHVDHIVIGARASSLRRTLLGSVSSQVAAQASCTVTVVRSRPQGRTPLPEKEAEESDAPWTVG